MPFSEAFDANLFENVPLMGSLCSEKYPFELPSPERVYDTLESETSYLQAVRFSPVEADLRTI
jgi:hypothetical protein